MSNAFTPEQIAQILEEFFKTVGARQYIGARYVPIFGRKDETSIDWDNTKPYEPLTIVLYLGNSYTSRQYVPAGVQITNQEFWAVTGNYNAQVEQYRRETARALQAAQDAQNDIDTLLPKTSFSSENTVKDYIDTAVQEVQNDIDTLLPKSAFGADNTVKDYIDEKNTEQYSDFVISFENVSSMKEADYLQAGMICKTSGFYSSGDFGGAYYKIVNDATANEIDIIALDNGLCASLVNECIANVCALGCKNDGSTDCSNIINYATEKYPLYFPYGIYRVDNPINLKNSIRGAIYNRLFYNNYPSKDFVCIIKSNYVGSDGVINITETNPNNDSITVENISIECFTNNKGINIATTHKPINIYINKVLIFNCETIGIHDNLAQGDSRHLYIDTVSIWHKLESQNTYNNSVGIWLRAGVFDSYLSNLEIMGFKRGITLNNGGFTRINNAHIWCYPLNPENAFDELWNGSLGIVFGNNTTTFVTDVYFDTCYTAASIQPKGIAKITNCYVYYGIAEGVTQVTGRPIFLVPNLATDEDCSFTVNNLVLEDKLSIANKITSNLKPSDAYYYKYDGVSIRSDISFENAYQMGIDKNEYHIQCENVGYEEIAKVHMTGGFARFVITNQFGYNIEVALFKDNNNAVGYKLSPTTPMNLSNIFYKFDGDYAKIYIKTSSEITVKPIANSFSATFINYNNFRNADNSEKTREVLETSDTLSAFTQA